MPFADLKSRSESCQGFRTSTGVPPPRAPLAKSELAVLLGCVSRARVKPALHVRCHSRHWSLPERRMAPPPRFRRQIVAVVIIISITVLPSLPPDMTIMRFRVSTPIPAEFEKSCPPHQIPRDCLAFVKVSGLE